MDLGAAWKLSRLLRELQPDVVHAHDRQALAMTALALSLGSAVLRTRFVASAPVGPHLDRNAFSRWQHQQVECFICASGFLKSMLIDEGVPAARTTVIGAAVDLAHVGASPVVDVHKEFWLPHNAPVVGNLSSLVPHAGQRYLIDAAAHVVQTVPDARFLIVGGGELDGMLRHQIKQLALEKHVLLAGHRPDELSLLKSFDLFAVSAVADGSLEGLLDAMACGRPVVATDVGSFSEVVQQAETGLLVAPRNAGSLAEAIIRLLEQPELRTEYGRRGLERVQQDFSVDRLVDETAALYRDVADRPRATDNPGLPSGD
jgi:glycosyltransferase involved in cell wall biosynthesis